jgi:TatA/E family protein of Tat protein translocase
MVPYMAAQGDIAALGFSPVLALFNGIGSGEIVIIMVVMLLLFGPKQLPELARTIANALRGIRKATDEMKEEIGLDELMGSRPRRPRQYRPPPNVPPSLVQGRPPESADATPAPADSPAPPPGDAAGAPPPDPYVELEAAPVEEEGGDRDREGPGA